MIVNNSIGNSGVFIALWGIWHDLDENCSSRTMPHRGSQTRLKFHIKLESQSQFDKSRRSPALIWESQCVPDWSAADSDSSDQTCTKTCQQNVTMNLHINWSTSELNTQVNPTTCLGDTGCCIQQVTAPTLVVTCSIHQLASILPSTCTGGASPPLSN